MAAGLRPTRFDWRRFLTEHGIDHAPHEGRGWAELHCPFCGDDDRGRHMGVHLDPESPGWSCWKDYGHRGRSPERLVQALLRCDHPTLRGVLARYQNHDVSGPNSSPPRPAAPLPHPGVLELPLESRPFTPETDYSRMFTRYLGTRGFDDPLAVAYVYDLRWCLTGPFQWRILIPVFSAHGHLITWTGRSIRPGINPKYRSLSHREYPGQPVALCNIKDTLYNWQHLQAGGRMLVITEGPFDAIRVDYSQRARGIRATCLFGKFASPSQFAALATAAQAFDRVGVLLDADALPSAWELGMTFRAFHPRVEVLRLPSGTKDPGELTPQQLQELFP